MAATLRQPDDPCKCEPVDLAARQLWVCTRRRFDFRHVVVDGAMVTGAEFMRRLQRLGKRRGVSVVFRPERGRGSHGILYFGSRMTVLKDRRKELSPGLLFAMLKQLGLNREDIR